MKIGLWSLAFFTFLSLGCSSEEISDDAVEMKVDFSWATGSSDTFPAVSVSNVPEGTRKFNVVMRDLDNGHDRAEYTLPNDDTNVERSDAESGKVTIRAGAVKGFRGHGEGWGQIRHRVTVKAIDGNDVVVGIGKKMRKYPEEDPYK